MTYTFIQMGNFLPLLLFLLLRIPPPPSLQTHISAWRPISQPPGPNPSLEAQIPRDWNLGLGVGIWALRVGFGPQDWDLGLEAEIWASWLRYGPGGWGRGVRRRRRRRRRKNFPICESIGHRPLRGRCPAPPSTTIITHSSRARVPLTI